MDNKKIIILSGGLDSTILLYHMINELKIKKENIIALSFSLDDKYEYHNDPNTTKYQNNSVELEFAKKTTNLLGIKHHIINVNYLKDVLDFMRNSDKHNINSQNKNKQASSMPFRNMILMSNAFSFAQIYEADEIYVGYQKQDQYGYWDTNMLFVSKLNEIAELNPDAKNVKIVCPFVEYSKSDEIRLGIKYNVPFENTWTCYNPLKKNKDDNKFYSCSKCLSCKERLYNFEKLNYKDPQLYWEEN